MSNIEENCLICAFTPIWKNNSFIGYSCLDINCEHTPTKNKYFIKISKKKMLISALYCLMILLDISYQLYNKLAVQMNLTIIDATYLVSDTLLAMSIFSLFFSLCYIKERYESFKGLIRIINSRRTYGIKTIFNRKIIIKLRTLSRIYVFLQISISIFYGFFLSRRVINAAAAYNYLGLAFYCSFEFRIYTLFFQRINQLINHSVKKEIIKNQHFDIIINSEDLFQKLSYLGSCQTAVYFNLKRYNLYINAMLTSGIANAICLLVATGYVVVNGLFGNVMVETNKDFFSMLFLLILASCGFADGIVNAQKLTNVNDKVLSQLTTYPMSELNLNEALQVENIIILLKTQTPTLTGANMFYINAALTASIASIVITYVLVILQFHPIWEE